MKRLASIALKVVALGIPMVIAACYGMSARFSRMGKVVDEADNNPIQDIKVSCIKDGAATDYTNSAYDGTWWLHYDVPCDSLQAEDTMNPARYQKATGIPLPDTDNLTIKLRKAQ